MRTIGGKVFFRIDGERLMVRGNITSNIGVEVVRETVVGLDEVHGTMDRIAIPFIQVDLTETPEFRLSRVNAVRDSTVTAELADGATLILSHAAHVGEAERNLEEGSLGSVRFEGTKGQEMPA
jgi:hypothetical protein